MQPTVRIIKKGAKRLRGGHPWAFRGEIHGEFATIEPGTMVRAMDDQGYFIGQGFLNPKSLIMFRLVTRQDIEIDDSFWMHRLERALRLRDEVLPNDTNTYRIVHAEADGIPGLVVDRYNDYLVVQTLIAGIDRHREMWVKLLNDRLEPRGMLARNDQKPRELEGMLQEKVVLSGTVPASLEVQENGFQFITDVWNGQKTGAFLDQRENRLAAKAYARGSVLDAFCYQGWFGIQCASEAEMVEALDGSAPALEMVRRNAEVNRIQNLQTTHENVFDFLYAADQAGRRFDVILLDPPAFAKSRQTIDSGLRGYKEINLRAMRLLPEGGILVTSSCSYHLSESQFLTVIEDAARDGGRQVQVLEKRTQGRDHPILLTHPESYYLKCLVLRIL